MTTYPTLIHERVAQAQQGLNPTVICKLPSGWAVMCDAQFLPGYCILLSDPVVSDLNVLNEKQRKQYLYDMTLIGDALLEVTDAYRINYQTLGNLDPALHTHVVPRYMSEPEQNRSKPPFSYDAQFRASRPFDAQRDRPLMEKLAEAIQSRL
jgi:diadenosine tetraphosphate (Ap4A) HIT family hydrolase